MISFSLNQVILEKVFTNVKSVYNIFLWLEIEIIHRTLREIYKELAAKAF